MPTYIQGGCLHMLSNPFLVHLGFGISICRPFHLLSICGASPFSVHLWGYFSPFAVHFWSVEWIKNGWNVDRKWILIAVCTVRRILSKTLLASNLLQEKDYSKAKKPSAKAKEFLYASTLHRNFLIQISNNKYANAILLPKTRSLNITCGYFWAQIRNEDNIDIIMWDLMKMRSNARY